MGAPAPLDPHLLGLVRWAWSRDLGLPDGALEQAAGTGRRLEVPASPADGVIHLQVGGATVLRAPQDVLEAACPLADEVLALESTLLRLAAAHAPRSLGELDLLYAAEAPEVAASSAVAVSEDPAHTRRLAARCPADDVHAAGLGPEPFALVPDDGDGNPVGEPVAAAGHITWHGLIARLGVLTAPEHRARGLGTYAAAVAAERAFLDGLVPEARIRAQDAPGQRIAAALGLVRAGSITALALTATR